MHSMTGYGRGSCEVAGRRLVVEMRSVNHRFLEIKLRLPWAEPAIEAQVTQAIRARLARGAITVSARDEGGGAAETLRADLALARQYRDALTEIARTLDLPDPVTLALVAAQPGVLAVGERAGDPDTLWRALAPGVDAALAALVEARAREGVALRTDLQARLATLDEAVRALGKLAHDAPEMLRKKLSDRLERALRPAGEIDPQRLAQEVAILADKADVSEELTRLTLHLVELGRLVGAGEASGRRLDFLTQELHREVNTIGSKSQSAEIAARIVDAKAEVERLREQIQNVE